MSDAELEAIRARHHPTQHLMQGLDEPTGYDVCIKDDDDWPCDTTKALARLDAAEARERALRAALVGVAPFTLGIDGTDCYCDEDDDGHSDACTAARTLLAEPAS